MNRKLLKREFLHVYSQTSGKGGWSNKSTVELSWKEASIPVRKTDVTAAAKIYEH